MRKLNVKKLMSITLVAAMAIGNAVSAKAAGTDIYVAENGSDSNTGTIDSPLKTFECARDKARQAPGSTIYVRGGTYCLTETLKLTSEDSGTNWKAYNDEDVYIQGGIKIDASNAGKVTNADIYNRLPNEVKDKVIQIDMKAQGITDYGVLEQYGMGVGGNPEAFPQYADREPLYPPTLYADSKLMTLCRYPNGIDNWLNVGKIYKKGSIPRNWLDDQKDRDTYVKPEDRENPPIGPTFGYTDERISTWTNAIDELWLSGMWQYDWAQCSLKVSAVDTQKKTIECLTTPSPYGISKGQRYFAFNIVEELDTQGEYYIDRKNGVLYFYPPDNFSGNLSLAVKDDMPVFEADGLTNAVFEGLTFEITKSEGFLGNNLNNVKFENCTFRSCGELGAQIKNSNKTGFNNCYIYNMPKSGILITGGGDEAQLIASENYITNCYFHDMGMVQKTFTNAYEILSVGTYVAHNEMHTLPFMGGNTYINSVTEYNQIYDAVRDVDDCGALGAGRTFIRSRGARINNNLIYDIGGMGAMSNTAARAIMLDDSLSGVEMTNNVIANVQSGISVNGGRDNIIKNNIFYKTGLNGKGAIVVNDHRDSPDSFFMEIKNELDSNQNWRNDVWKEAFPSLYSVMDNGNEYKKPSNNVIEDNLLLNSNGVVYLNNFPQISSLKNNYEGDAEKNLFKNEDRRDFRFTNNSSGTQLQNTFKNIDVENIGLSQRKLIRNSLALKIGSNAAFIQNSAKYIDKDNAKVKPEIINDRTMVPLRFIAESFGADVNWNGAAREVSISLDDINIKMNIDKTQYTVNGVAKELDVPAMILNDRTMVPLRAVSESLNKEVYWNDCGLIIVSNNGTNMNSMVDNKTAKQILRFFDNPYITPEISTFSNANGKNVGHANDSIGFVEKDNNNNMFDKYTVPSSDTPKGTSSVSGKKVVKEYNFETDETGFSANYGKQVSDFVVDEFAKSGKKSLKVSGLTHFYLGTECSDAPNGIVTLWMYDYADTELDSYFLVNVSESEYKTPHQAIGIKSDVSKDNYIWFNGDDVKTTNVKRTAGWHELKFDYTNGKDMVMSIDGQVVGTVENGTEIYQIAIFDNWKEDNQFAQIYIDDVQIWN